MNFHTYMYTLEASTRADERNRMEKKFSKKKQRKKIVKSFSIEENAKVKRQEKSKANNIS